MDNVKSRMRRPAPRRLIQLYSALLHNAHLKGFLEGEIYQGGAKAACVPGLNCYSCPAAVGACPLGALQNALAAGGHRAGWYVLGILLLFGVTLGRTICGWLCPMGLLQELLHRLPTFKIRKSRVTAALSRLKYGILAVFVIAVPLWFGLARDLPLPAFCKYICPAGTLEGALTLLSHPGNAPLLSLLGTAFTSKFVILCVILLACIFCYRSFCRFLCPLGAIYGLFNRFCLVGVQVDPVRCSGCGACVRACSMDVRHVGDTECIHCAQCMESCTQKAISLKAGKISLKAAEEPSPDTPKRKAARRIAGAAALLLLCFALLWFNVLDPGLRTSPAAPTGSAVGEVLGDFRIDCLDGTSFHLTDTRGRVTILNLWATYCKPCVEELAYFDALARQYPDEVAILAVHSSVITDDPAAFLEGRGWTIPFAVDTEEDLVWKLTGGSSVLPQTVVLNRRGEVIYNQKGSVTPEALAALFALAAAD